jgi:hypothetical protein
MNSNLPMHLSPRCSATSKRTKLPCQAPAVTGWTVCRFHGAGGGGPRGERNGAYRHGFRTAEAQAAASAMSELLQQVRRSIAALSEK